MTKPKKQQPNRAGPQALMGMYESEFELVNGTMDYMRSLLLPELSEPQRVPDEVVATSALFKSPQVIENLLYSGRWNASEARTDELQENSPGESVVVAIPSVFGAIWHTLGEQAEIAPTVGQVLTPSLVENVTMIPAGTTNYLAHALRNENVGIIPRLGSAGFPTYEVTLDSTGAATQIAVSLYSPSRRGTSAIVSMTFRARFVGDNNFTTIARQVATRDGFGSEVFDFTAVQVVEAFRITVNDTADDWRFSIGSNIEAAVPTPLIRLEARSSCAYRIRNVDQLIGLALTNSIRPAAMSGLTTWMGSTLENGGNIAVARLPAGQCISLAPSGDYYGFLSQLPVYAGDYPLKEGAYAWWCPDSEQEYFFQPYGKYRGDDLREVQTLVFAMRRDEVNQTVRFRLDANFEALSRSVQYVSEVGPTSPEFPRMLAVAKTLPAVSINEKHEGFFKRLFSKAKSWLSQPTNWQKMLRAGTKLLTGI